MGITITELQTAVVTGVAAAIPDLHQCEMYGGQFSGEPGKRTVIHAPAVFIAALGSKALADPGTGEMDMQLKLVAYVLARFAGDRKKREGGCIDLAEAVALFLHRNTFGMSYVGMGAIQKSTP